jgi:hypothetical protein
MAEKRGTSPTRKQYLRATMMQEMMIRVLIKAGIQILRLLRFSLNAVYEKINSFCVSEMI